MIATWPMATSRTRQADAAEHMIPRTPPSDPAAAARRQRVRRTALWVAVIAALFYLGFIALVGMAQ